MIKKYKSQQQGRLNRTRLRLKSRSDLPRLSVFRSNKKLYAQIIDDMRRMTLAAACDKSAKVVGEKIAVAALKAKIKKIVFDRGSYAYHGKVKQLADAARQAGLDF